MTEHDIDMAQEWLNRVRRECSILLLRVANGDIEPDMNDMLADYFNEPVPVMPITSEVKNFIATACVTDMRVYNFNRTLQNNFIERMLKVIQIIRNHEWSNYVIETNEIVPPSAA